MTLVAHSDKVELRAHLLAARRARSAADLSAQRDAIRTLLLERVVDSGWRTVAAYLPMATEPGSLDLLAELTAAGRRVLVPQVLPDRDLDWALWSAEGLGAGLGVHAIASCDAVLAPALAVSRTGVRLGRGGGSYDRALTRCRPGTAVIALVFADEVRDALPVDPWDVPVAEAVTPSGFVRLG